MTFRQLLNSAFVVVIGAGLLLMSAKAQEHPGIGPPIMAAQNSGTKSRLIAVSPVDARTVWVSGTDGTFVVTTNGGKTWHAGVVPGAESLQFRDVQGVSERVAYLLSIGDHPSDFRIYKTEDGGRSWKLQFQNQLANAFYDCFAFWTPDRGIAHSDSVDKVFPDLRTVDGGSTWENIGDKVPAALPAEGSFASSGTCVATEGKLNAWIATGSSSIARILKTGDGGETWTAYNLPLKSSSRAGAFTVAFRDSSNGMVAGGELNAKDGSKARVAISGDGGQTWKMTNEPPITGTIFGLSYVYNATGFHHRQPARNDSYERAVVVTGNTGGAAWTPDEGNTWYFLPGVSGYWGVAFADPHHGWMVGQNGTILKISF